jgi:MoaA/NifB/PqqE/SkfB family radical SAM enzyme
VHIIRPLDINIIKTGYIIENLGILCSSDRLGIKKLLSLSYTALKSNFVSLDKPYKLNFAITMHCQSRCLTCNIWQLKPAGELTLEEIREFARKNNYFKWIEITGGEPFLRSDIVEIVRAFRDSSKDLYIVTIPTNSLTNPDVIVKRVKEILELGIPRLVLTLSLDGYRELHDKIRGVPGNYDRVINLYRRLSEVRKEHKGLDFLFGYTMSSYNSNQLMETLKRIKEELPELNNNDFHINLAQESDNYYHNQGAGSFKVYGEGTAREIEELIKTRRFEMDPAQIVEGAFLKKLAAFARTGQAPLRSRSLEVSVYIDNMGDIYPSIMWNKKIGNLREIGFDLSKVWNSEEAKEVRRAIKEGMEPVQWTSCEAYQSLTGNIPKLIF